MPRKKLSSNIWKKRKDFIKLNLGSGRNPLNGFVNVDVEELPETDLIHDLNKFPYPFKDNSVSEIYSDNTFEHLNDMIKVMEELHRICKPGAVIKIIVPYYMSSGAYHDITHKQFFTSKSFNTFTNWSTQNFYTSSRFKILRIKTKFTRKDWIFNKFIDFFMNISLLRWLNERIYPFAIPMQEIEYDLVVVK